MGIAGAALATFIARVFEAMLDLGYLVIIDTKIGFRIRHMFMKTKTLISEYLRVCIPVLISDAILAFGSNAVTMVIGHLGGDFVAANSITTVTQQLSTVLIQGVCQAGAIITGQTLGKGKKEQAEVKPRIVSTSKKWNRLLDATYDEEKDSPGELDSLLDL